MEEARHDRPRGPDGPTLIRLGAVLEGLLVLLAWALWSITAPGAAFDLAGRLGPVSAVWPGLGLGLGLALFVLTLRAAWPGLRQSVDPVLLGVFGSAGFWPLALVSLMAAFAEELLFRGVLQAWLGLLPSALLFGLAHWGGRRELTVYGLVALALGLAFGWSYHVTGHLLVVMAAHASYNLVVCGALRLGLIARE